MCNKPYISLFEAPSRHVKRNRAQSIYAWAIYTVTNLNVYVYGLKIYIYCDLQPCTQSEKVNIYIYSTRPI